MYIDYLMMSMHIGLSYDDYTAEDIELALMRLEEIDMYIETTEDFRAREMVVMALDLHRNPLKTR